MFSKSYKVILEYIKINIVSENIDWINKNITVNSNSENIIINIQRLENAIGKSLLPDLITNKKAITYNDIIHYWNKNLVSENNFINTNTNTYTNTSLKINEDYFIVPCYIINGLVILGIVIFNNSNPSNVKGELPKILETYNYLSTIKPLDNINANANANANTNENINKFNIINGILNYRINSSSGKIKLLGKEILSNKYLKILIHSDTNNNQDHKHNHEQELLIKWEHIFRNIANYLPKFKIIYKSKENAITNFFQNRLNP